MLSFLVFWGGDVCTRVLKVLFKTPMPKSVLAPLSSLVQARERTMHGDICASREIAVPGEFRIRELTVCHSRYGSIFLTALCVCLVVMLRYCARSGDLRDLVSSLHLCILPITVLLHEAARESWQMSLGIPVAIALCVNVAWARVTARRKELGKGFVKSNHAFPALDCIGGIEGAMGAGKEGKGKVSGPGKGCESTAEKGLHHKERALRRITKLVEDGPASAAISQAAVAQFPGGEGEQLAAGISAPVALQWSEMEYRHHGDQIPTCIAR